ncbi:hypothetical protein GH854_34155, partial [Bacillus thuringiensis]|nr:hypothetical protein [Bacillus thuringiensis]
MCNWTGLWTSPLHRVVTADRACTVSI